VISFFAVKVFLGVLAAKFRCFCAQALVLIALIAIKSIVKNSLAQWTPDYRRGAGVDLAR
jgi:hypothetical protein